jgi:CRP/FNR family transcriptional regulator
MTIHLAGRGPLVTSDHLTVLVDATPTSAKCATVQCSRCTLPACMHDALDATELHRLDDVIHQWRRVARGHPLFRAGDPFQSLYAIRAGSFKTVASHRPGREQVTDFYLPGETLGLDGIGTGHHDSNAIALEDSAVCVIPFDAFQTLCADLRPLQHHMHRMLSAEIVRRSGLMLLLGSMSAEQRVATFLLGISVRLQARGYSPTEFTLRMTREEIGSYLGMQLATVSRMLSRFQQAGMVQVDGKHIMLTEPESLRSLL